MSMFANNALLGGGVRARVYNRKSAQLPYGFYARHLDNVGNQKVTENQTPLACVASALPLSYDSQTTTPSPLPPLPTILYMWQSRVEIEHYSVAYFLALLRLKHSSVELLLRAGLIQAG